MEQGAGLNSPVEHHISDKALGLVKLLHAESVHGIGADIFEMVDRRIALAATRSLEAPLMQPTSEALGRKLDQVLQLHLANGN